MSHFINNLAAITMLTVIAGMLAFALPIQTFSASNNVNINLNVEEGNQDRGDDRGGQSASLIIRINNVTRGQDFLEISWETTVRSQTTVRWARAEGGKEMMRASQRKVRQHTTRLENLQAGTRYEVQLQADAVTGETKTRREVIRTRLPAAPDSPAGFQANLTAENHVLLRWNLPAESSDYIRVTRSEDFFPQEPMEGKRVYEGRADQFIDQEVEESKTYFYSAFVRDENDQWSAASLAAIYVPMQGEQTSQQNIEEIVNERPQAPQDTRDLLSDLQFADLIFSQADHTVSIKDKTARLAAGRRFSVGLDYDALPEVLKTVMITISRPGRDQSFSFLLRRDEAGEFYTATVGALKEVGSFQAEMTVLDYKYRRVKTLTGSIATYQPDTENDSSPTVISRLGDISREADSGSFAWILLILIIFGGLIISLEKWLKSQGEMLNAK